jgi:hypothetical protein
MTGDYGDNPDPRVEEETIRLAGIAWSERAHSRSKDPDIERRIIELDKRWAEEKLARSHTAGLFLDEVDRYRHDFGVISEDIPLKKKAELLQTYGGFTGIENPDYPQGVSEPIIHQTFREKYLEARNLP